MIRKRPNNGQRGGAPKANDHPESLSSTKEQESVMRHSVRSTRTHTLKASRGLAAIAAVLMGAGSVFLLTSGSASASTLGGVATISVPDGTAPMTSGASTDPFTVDLPANAACTGDTATDGYHVFSYMVPQGTDVSSLTFTEVPSTGFGFVNNIGTYYGAANTAANTGQIISIPNNFEFGPLVSDDGVSLSTFLYSGGTTGVWEAGLACANSSGALTDNWNTEVTFTASGSDPSGFAWATAAGTTPPPTSTTTTAPGSPATTTTTAPSGVVTTTTAPTGDPSTTTTTTTAAGGAVGGTSAGTGSTGTGSTGTGSTGTGSTGTGSTGTGSSGSSGALPFTGAPVTKYLGAGLLAIGVALMLLGWANRRVRLARTDRSTPR
jgi:hypothetical protein